MSAEMRARLDAIPRKPYTTSQLAVEVGYVPPAREIIPPNDLPSNIIDFVNRIIPRNPNPSKLRRPYKTKLR
jgi:hypothetical protein